MRNLRTTDASTKDKLRSVPCVCFPEVKDMSLLTWHYSWPLSCLVRSWQPSPPWWEVSHLLSAGLSACWGDCFSRFQLYWQRTVTKHGMSYSSHLLTAFVFCSPRPASWLQVPWDTGCVPAGGFGGLSSTISSDFSHCLRRETSSAYERALDGSCEQNCSSWSLHGHPGPGPLSIR